MGKIDGRTIALKIDSVVLAGRTSSSISFSADMLDKTTADSAGYKEYLSGEKGSTISVGALYDRDAAEGMSEAIAYLMAGTELKLVYGETETGGKYFTCDGIISSVNFTGDKNTVANYTLDIQVTGEWTIETVSGSST